MKKTRTGTTAKGIVAMRAIHLRHRARGGAMNGLRLSVVAALLGLVLFVCEGCARTGAIGENGDWESVAKTIHERVVALRSDSGMDTLLAGLVLDRVGVDALTEINNNYYMKYVEPQLDDRITEGIARLIRKKIGDCVSLKVGESKYAPHDVFVVTRFDPVTYRSVRENTYADDSLHLPEFPENYGTAVSYREGEAARMLLDPSLSDLTIIPGSIGPRTTSDRASILFGFPPGCTRPCRSRSSGWREKPAGRTRCSG